MSAGQVMGGASSSVTMTLNPQLAPLPLASVALHTTALVPTAKVEPLGGVHPLVTPGQLSLAVAA